jgi:uncharacterized protein
MDTIKEQGNLIRPGLYSLKQIFIATIIGGPAIAGFIIAFNLWARKKKLLAIIPVLPGLLLNVLLIIAIYFSARHILINFRIALAIVLYFLFQTVFAFIIKFILRKSKAGTFIFPEIDENVYHKRKWFPVIIISIIYFFVFFNFISHPYLWIVLGLYLFLHFYGYIHIYKTFGNYKIVTPFLYFIVFLACLYPIVDTSCEIISVYTKKEYIFYTYLNLIVGYYMIFVFYLLLFILGLNILLFINQRIKVVTVSGNKTVVFVTILLIVISGVILLGVGTYINNLPKINKYSITIPKRYSTLNSLKVICVSDLHLKNITSMDFLKKLTNDIRLANPDIIVLPGDIVEGNTDKQKLTEFIGILKDIKAKYGIYAVKGNHDFPGDMADKIGFYKQLGITMLEDSLIEIDNKFCIIGLNYRGNHEKRPIDSLLRFKTKDLPILLLDHAPYCLEEAYKNKIDVQFSGHTHYGQIWPLNYITEVVYDIAWGYKKINSTNIFVSCGVQDALLPSRQDFSVPVRIGSVSEIMEIDVKLN